MLENVTLIIEEWTFCVIPVHLLLSSEPWIMVLASKMKGPPIAFKIMGHCSAAQERIATRLLRFLRKLLNQGLITEVRMEWVTVSAAFWSYAFLIYLWSHTSSVYLSQDRSPSMEGSWECVQNVANAELASSIRRCGDLDPLMFSCSAAAWAFEWNTHYNPAYPHRLLASAHPNTLNQSFILINYVVANRTVRFNRLERMSH